MPDTRGPPGRFLTVEIAAGSPSFINSARILGFPQVGLASHIWRIQITTSPVGNLATVGRLALLRSQFGRVLIPEAVDRELADLKHVAASEGILTAKAEGWLEVVHEGHAPLIWGIEERIDRGEASAIAVALDRGADLLLLVAACGQGFGAVLTGLSQLVARKSRIAWESADRRKKSSLQIRDPLTSPDRRRP